MFQDREYQTYAVNQLFKYFLDNTGNPLVLMPTGTGKSVVIARFILEVLLKWASQKIIVCAHVKELIEQNSQKLRSMWPNAPIGINSAELGSRDFIQSAVFASIQSVFKSAKDFGCVNLLIIDEAHMVSPEDKSRYQRFIKELLQINPNLKVIGFTATGWRTKGGHLVDEKESLFTDVCVDMTTIDAFNWFFNQGYLCRLTPKRTQLEYDLTGVRKLGDDYNQKDLIECVDKNELTEALIRESISKGEDRNHWLGFFSGVNHAIVAAEILNDYGIPTVAIHSDLKSKQRDDYIDDWKRGKYKCATNNNILTTGIDFPGIDLILMGRPTLSSNLWVQMLGRGTRCVYAPGFDLTTTQGRLEAISAGPKQDCLVLDFSANTRNLGPINDPKIPTKGKKGPKVGAPVKECLCCDTYNHISAKNCIKCNEEFTFEIKFGAEASGLDIIKADLPQVDILEVTHVTYRMHEKEGSPPSIKITYYCGVLTINEFVFPEANSQWAAKKFAQWWSGCGHTGPLPNSVEVFLDVAENLTTPTHLRVWVNAKYPSIMAKCFDGTAFGTQSADKSKAHVKPIAYKPDVNITPAYVPPPVDGFDDDIPF